MTFDRRIWPVNDRVVAYWLADRFPGRMPVRPADHIVSVPVLDLSLSPGGRRDRQLLYGWSFAVLERCDDFAFGLCPAADYVGWVAANALSPSDNRTPATAAVLGRQTHAYERPDMKSRDVAALPFSSLVVKGRTQGRFAQTEIGWVPVSHLDGKRFEDPTQVARLFLGAPYLWGGNSAFGIDCSGLVQSAMNACGLSCPADSDLQEAELGHTLPPGTPYAANDLLFWKGHVALVVDPVMLIHANAYHMAVAYEPITQAIARIEAQGDGPVTRHARIDLAGCNRSIPAKPFHLSKNTHNPDTRNHATPAGDRA